MLQRWFLTLVAALGFALSAAQAWSPDDLTDAAKARILATARRLLVSASLPAYREIVGRRFDSYTDAARPWLSGTWTIHRYGGATLSGGSVGPRLVYWLGREALTELRWSYPIGDFDERQAYRNETRLTPDEAKDNLARALREVLVPEPWTVGVEYVERQSHFEAGVPVFYAFEFTPRYRGYVYSAGERSAITVDPLSGCIVSMDLNNAGFPLVDPEDVPILSRERVAELGRVALDAYARYRPLATAEAGRGVALLIVPHFQNRPNTMTLRHRLRSELLMPVLLVERQFLGRDAQGRLTMQEFFVDPIRGVPLAVNEYPLDGWAPLGSGVPAPLRLDPAEGRWALADGSVVRARKARTPRDPKDDGTVVLFDEQGRTAAFRFDASRRLLWTEGPSGREAWSVSRSDAARLVRSVREATPTFATAPKTG